MSHYDVEYEGSITPGLRPSGRAPVLIAEPRLDRRAEFVQALERAGYEVICIADPVAIAFGPDGRLYACQNGRKRIVAYAPDGAESVTAEGVGSNDLAALTQTNPSGGRPRW